MMRWRAAPVLTTLATALLLTLLLPAASAQDRNPGYDRPGLGFTPAVLTAGAITFEQGLPDFSRGANGDEYDADSLLRVGLGGNLELQLGSGWSRVRDAATHAIGRADSSVGLKWANRGVGDFTWGLLGSVEFTDGAAALRAARRVWTLGASFNWQRDGAASRGLYLEAGRGASSHQLAAINTGWTWGEAWGGYVELGVEHDPADGSGSVAGGGFTWQAMPRLQLDFGARHRLTGGVDTWQAGFGVAWYFGP